jgi:hypothetical protein
MQMLGKCLFVSTSKLHSHGYTRSYFGEFDAAPLIEWLNRRDRPSRDPVEKLIRLNAEVGDVHAMVLGRNPEQEIAALVRRYRAAVAPVVGVVNVGGWEIDWKLVPNIHPSQGLALIKLLHLAERGLLERIRQCAWQDCHKWFFARFSHKVCCSGRCQQRHVRSTPEGKKKKREYMQRYRAETKQREKRQREIYKRKGKP